MSNNNEVNSPGGKTVGIGIVAVFIVAPIVAVFEGFMPTTYADPVGIPTVCFGETDSRYTIQDRFTREECSKILENSLKKHAEELSKCVVAPLSGNEAAAILSWGYNVGTNAACSSTLVRMVNEGRKPEIWCKELKKWVYAKKKKLRGLEKRRELEYQLCIGNVPV